MGRPSQRQASGRTAAAGNTLVDVEKIGVAGRVYIGGETRAITRACDTITSVLEAVEGRTL